MVINKHKIVNNKIIKIANKSFPDTTCSKSSVTIKTRNILEKKFSN